MDTNDKPPLWMTAKAHDIAQRMAMVGRVDELHAAIIEAMQEAGREVAFYFAGGQAAYDKEMADGPPDEVFERGWNDDSAKPAGEPWNIRCDTCEGQRTVYQEHQAGCNVGGWHACPDCDGKGYFVKHLAAAPAPSPVLTDAEIHAIHSLPFVRDCLLCYHEDPQDETAAEVVKAIAAQVRALGSEA